MAAFGAIWALLGLFILIISFVAFNSFTIILGFAMMGTGLRIANNAVNRRNEAELVNKLKNANFVGKKLETIEADIGVHTSVNISNDDKRIYSWGDYLELLCDKNNKCIEVLKNSYADKKD